MKRYILTAISLFVLPVSAWPSQDGLILSPPVQDKSAKDAQIPKGEINHGGPHEMINKERIDSFLKNAQNELEHNILRFWIKYCRDNENGGFIGRMSNDRTIVKDAPKGLVLNARILWTFSAAYRYEKNEDYLEMARRSFDYLMQYFWISSLEAHIGCLTIRVNRWTTVKSCTVSRF